MRTSTVWRSDASCERALGGALLVESTRFGLPILARMAAAVPETLGGSGMLLRDKACEATAELIAALLEDEGLRCRIVARQRERLRGFLPANIQPHLGQLLRELSLGR